MSPAGAGSLTGIVLLREGAGPAEGSTQVAALEQVCVSVLVVVSDPLLDGLIQGLEVASTPLVAAVQGGPGTVEPQLFPALAACWRGEAAVVPLVAGRVRPFPGVYATSWARSLRRQFAGGRRGVIPALSALSARVVGPEVWGGVAELGGS